MRIFAGTSGFSYREWKGPFYPADLPARGMLGYYASRLPAVEINNTFYRQPTEEMLRGWRSQVPASFRFAIKAPRRITHVKRLRGCGEEVSFLLERTAVLEQSLGAVLFQLPPSLRRDDALLAAFADALPPGTRGAFEFRHPSWLEEPVFRLLGEHDFALVLAETDEQAVTDLPFTAGWAYLRLRKTAYGDAELSSWARRLQAAELSEAYAFFKHEDEAAGPLMAQRFLATQP